MDFRSRKISTYGDLRSRFDAIWRVGRWVIRSEHAADIDIARDIAEVWKQAALDKGFDEVTGGPGR